MGWRPGFLWKLGWFFRQAWKEKIYELDAPFSRTMVRANVDVWKNLLPFWMDDIDGKGWYELRRHAGVGWLCHLTVISWERRDGFNTVILIHRCGGAHVITCLVVMHSNNITCITGYGMFWYSNRSTKADLDLDIIPRKAQGAVCTLWESLKVDNSLCKMSLTFRQSQV